MILNGRHRMAISLYFNIEPIIKVTNELGYKRFKLDLNFYKVFSNLKKKQLF